MKLIGTLTWNYQYNAYGVQKNPDPQDGNAFRYAGQYFDTEVIHIEKRNGDLTIMEHNTQGGTGTFPVHHKKWVTTIM